MIPSLVVCRASDVILPLTDCMYCFGPLVRRSIPDANALQWRKGGLGEKLASLIAQHNEHSVGFLHLLTVACFSLFGSLNFITFQIFGNAFLVGIFILLWKARKDADDKIVTFIPVSLLLFQPQFYDTVLWPTVLLSNFASTFFVLLTFILL